MKETLIARIAAVALAAAFLVVAGCDDDSTGPEGNVGDITVTATSATTPVYSWEGGPIATLRVVRTTDLETAVWSVVTPDTNAIISPVTHGMIPPGAAEVVDSTAREAILAPGIEYRVTVLRDDGTYGRAWFTP